MTLALRITTASKHRYVEIDNLAEALVWLYSHRAVWSAIAEDERRLAIVIRRGGGRL